MKQVTSNAQEVCPPIISPSQVWSWHKLVSIPVTVSPWCKPMLSIARQWPRFLLHMDISNMAQQCKGWLWRPLLCSECLCNPQKATWNRLAGIIVSGKVYELFDLVRIFQELNSTLKKKKKKRKESYMLIIIWRLVPLRPLYCLFSNIVATSDALDLKIIQDVAKRLPGLAKTHRSIIAIDSLCNFLVDLNTEYSRKEKKDYLLRALPTNAL